MRRLLHRCDRRQRRQRPGERTFFTVLVALDLLKATRPFEEAESAEPGGFAGGVRLSPAGVLTPPAEAGGVLSVRPWR
jgi:hypothetical protein